MNLIPTTWTVKRRSRETSDTVTLALTPPVGASPEFQPGQFNMIYVHGVGEIPVSISGYDADGRSQLHTIRDVGAVSRALCRQTKGDEIGVRGPFGKAWPLAALAGRDVFILAGGLGLAPLRPTIRALAADRERYGQVTILYGGRAPGGLLYPGERETWEKKCGFRVLTTVDHAAPGWRGRIGVVTGLLPAELDEPSRTAALLCGPEIMMRFASDDLRRLGIPDPAIFLSLERNMKCAVGLCGRCQLNRHFVCKDGPVFSLAQVREFLPVREL